MFVFFAAVRSAGYNGQEIWETLYFLEVWQLFFDAFNSAPLFLVIFGIAVWKKHLWWQLLAGSALLHIACDFPLHHDDSHRHFLPFSQFRFSSPVSYWDPKHFGIPLAILEAVLAIMASLYLLCRTKGKLVRWSVGCILALYGLVLCAVIIFLLRRPESDLTQAQFMNAVHWFVA